MVDQGKTRLRRIVFRSLLAALASLCLMLVSGGLWLVIKDLGDYTKVSLDQCPYLRRGGADHADQGLPRMEERPDVGWRQIYRWAACRAIRRV